MSIGQCSFELGVLSTPNKIAAPSLLPAMNQYIKSLETSVEAFWITMEGIGQCCQFYSFHGSFL